MLKGLLTLAGTILLLAGTAWAQIGQPGVTNPPTSIVGAMNVYGGSTGIATLGDELIQNGTFDTGTAGWTATGWTWGSGKVRHDAGNTNALSTTVTLTTGRSYQMSWTHADRTTNSYTVTVGGVTVASPPYTTANQNYGFSFVSDTTGSATVAFTPETNHNGSIDTVSIKEITGSSPATLKLFDSTGASFVDLRGDSTLANLGLGTTSLGSITSGYNNIAIGKNAGASITTGANNIAIGNDALKLGTTGLSNIIFGSTAGDAITTGSGNTAIGNAALGSLTTAAYNIAIGPSALWADVTGTSNIAIGSVALNGATADYNTAVGVDSGYTTGATPSYNNKVTTGSRLTFFGYRSGLGSTTQRTNSGCFGQECYIDADNTYAIGDENVTAVYMSSDAGATVYAAGVKNTPTGGSLTVGSTQAYLSSADGYKSVTAGNSEAVMSADSASSGNANVQVVATGVRVTASDASTYQAEWHMTPFGWKITDTLGTRPTCDSSNRGVIWYKQGGTDVADIFEICRKDASNVYAWVTLF